jgi:hypothetical protein
MCRQLSPSGRLLRRATKRQCLLRGSYHVSQLRIGAQNILSAALVRTPVSYYVVQLGGVALIAVTLLAGIWSLASFWLGRGARS